MIPSPLTAFTFDAEDVPEPQRFDSWRELMFATHDVALPDRGGPSFHANVAIWNLDQLLLSHGEFSAQSFIRDRDNIRRDQLDHYGLFVQGQGRRVIRFGDDDEAVLKTGDVFVYDLAQPTASLATEGSSGTLYLPRDVVEELIPQFSRYHGSVLTGAAGRLLAGHVNNLGRYLPEMLGQSMSFLANSARELALGCLLEHVEQGVEENGPVEHALRRDIERFIENHLGDPGLCATSICAAYIMSRTTLYRLFDRHAGVAAYIKSRRLHRIRAILVADQDSRPLVEIAQDYGFRTGAHFSREFRAMFGYAPSDVRASTVYTPRLEPDSPDRSRYERIFRSLYA